jgi:hypothetical protein
MFYISVAALVIAGIISKPVVAFDKTFYDQNGIVWYNPDACENMNITSTPGSCAKLAEIRQEMVKDLTDLELKQIFTYPRYESDGDELHVIAQFEELLNRAYSNRNSGTASQKLKHELSAYYHYYAHFNCGGGRCNEGDLHNGAPSDKKEYYDSAWAKVLGGSDVTHGATDNASVGLAASKSKETFICGIKNGDTACERDKYRGSDGRATGEAGVEFFFNNNGAGFNEFYKENCGSDGSGSTSATNSSAPVEVSGGMITWIGDSISVGALDKIRAKFSGVATDSTIDQIKDSKQFAGTVSGNPTGMELLDTLIAGNQLRDYVVFALGTNNTGLTKEQVESAITKVGENRKIIFVTNYYDGDDNHFKKNNESIRAAAVGKGNVIIADWASAAKNNKVNFDSMKVHPADDTGKQRFVDTIFNSISGGSTTTQKNCGESGVKRLGELAFPLKITKKTSSLNNSAWTKETTYHCQGNCKFYYAFDLMIDDGTEVLAVHAGEVISVNDGTQSSLGANVMIYDSVNDITYFETHMADNSIVVKKGQTVAAGDKIGIVSTVAQNPDVNAPHLHIDANTGSGREEACAGCNPETCPPKEAGFIAELGPQLKEIYDTYPD